MYHLCMLDIIYFYFTLKGDIFCILELIRSVIDTGKQMSCLNANEMWLNFCILNSSNYTISCHEYTTPNILLLWQFHWSSTMQNCQHDGLLLEYCDFIIYFLILLPRGFIPCGGWWGPAEGKNLLKSGPTGPMT